MKLPCSVSVLSLLLALSAAPLAMAQESSGASSGSGSGSNSGEEDASIAAIESETKHRLIAEQRRLVARYTDDLSALRKAQQDKGDTAGAAATATEIARAKAALAEGGDPGAFLSALGKSPDTPAAAAAGTGAADAPVEPDASRKVIALKPDNARSVGGSAWVYEGSGKVWTITDAPAGLYTMVLTGSASREGTLSVRLGAGQRTSAKFSPGAEELVLGRISITTTPVELFLTVSDLKGYSEKAAVDVRNLTLRPVKLSAPAAPK